MGKRIHWTIIIARSLITNQCFPSASIAPLREALFRNLLNPYPAPMEPQPSSPWLISQRIVQVCLFLFAAICLFGGTVQMILGEPDTTPRLDNIHRFLAGVYLGTGFICAWTAWTVRKQNTLIYLLALGGFLAGMGRLISMNIVGLPEPHGLWLGYLASEIIVPVVIVVAQAMSRR
jgi:hypothetical protein